jgi:hypothetical protein
LAEKAKNVLAIKIPEKLNVLTYPDGETNQGGETIFNLLFLKGKILH